jgi:hypothetical protein
MRVKSQWFRSGRNKTPSEIAGAAAFIIWRIALNALNGIRGAGFDIAVGPQYFSFLSEFLIFLVQLADRIAYRHYGEAERVAFTTALANRVGENLAENQVNLMGSAAMSAYKADFIARLNLRAAEYAEFPYEQDGSNFSFMRQLGNCMEAVVDERDRRWVTDQVMAINAPEAIATLEKSMRGLLELEPKRQRTRSDASGD